MAEKLNFAFDIDQPAAPIERSINSGSTWTALPVPTTGTHKTALLTGIPAAVYAVGVLQIRPVGYPAKMVSNTVAVTVAAAAPAGTTSDTSNAFTFTPASGTAANYGYELLP